MRRVTPEALKEERLALARLEEDWKRLNRPQVNKGLRDSLYTRMVETRAHLANMEAQMRKAAGRRPGRQEAEAVGA